jgi:hypothetical protein
MKSQVAGGVVVAPVAVASLAAPLPRNMLEAIKQRMQGGK